MATTLTGLSQTKVISNLDTYNHTAGSTSMYVAEVRMTEIPASGISIVIKQNSNTIITSVVPAATQSAIVVRALINATVNDTLTVVISSAAANDQNINAIKGILNIHPGIA